MSYIEFINEVVLAGFEGLWILMLFLAITDNKDFLKNRKFSVFIAVSMYAALCYWFRTYLPGFHTIGILIFGMMILSIITKTNFYSSIIAYLASSVFMVIVELAVTSLVVFIFRMNIKTILSTPEYKLISVILIQGMQGVIAILVFTKDFIKINSSILRKEGFTIAFPFFEIGLVSTFAVSFIYAGGNDDNNYAFHGVFFTVILLLIIMNIIDYRERENMFKLKSKFEKQQEYLKNMETVVDIIRKEKHDFINHLNTISGICKLRREDALEKVEEYLDKLTNNYQSSYTFYSTGNDYVDGLLAVKSNYAHQCEIQMDVDFDAPLNEADVDEGDIVGIMSNIVDNAFEALCTEEKPHKKILSILAYADSSGYYISISNNGPKIPEKYLQRVFNNMFSTKALENSENKDRGYGLYIVEQLVRRNGGSISVTSNSDNTEFLIKFKHRFQVKNKTA